MSNNPRKEILKRIKEGLYHSRNAVKEEPLLVRQKTIGFPHDLQQESRILIDQFIEEITRVSGNACVVEGEDGIRDFIIGLIEERGSGSFAIWESDLLTRLRLREFLEGRGLKFTSPNRKEEMARADIGITEADFAIADTGTLVLIANQKQPRSVSLIPPIHIAILDSQKIVRNIHDLFAMLANSIADMESINELTSCITFITGPSRTADIELNLTLGVHGPKGLFVLIYP